ncbi:hypothetical protein SAMN04487949_1731 [Halogranum gelatinilyticum]|uniref:DUF7577 domain-containing protein n=1 Tax=Halogranum gelatinilyticum TaxID=660521 RepID=A0A1G9TDT8_9EURY|nr:zinc ribbon domain-containing protein [Halogranum gelatinilyticum]SDM45856.1 hypothetical protein SAMN04487949_1731 [Halogranum gelatinilyticum]
MELVFRLLVAGVLIVAPSLLFLGLWHGLHALRDDELIARMNRHTAGSFDDSPLVSDFLPTVDTDAIGRESFVACGTCGTPNPDDVRFCHECLSPVGR